MTDNNELVMTGEEQTAEETEQLEPEFSPFVPKPLFNLEKGDTAFALCALAASVFTSVFGLFGGFSLGYLLSVVLMMALFTAYFGRRASVGGFAVVSGLLVGRMVISVAGTVSIPAPRRVQPQPVSRERVRTRAVAKINVFFMVYLLRIF